VAPEWPADGPDGRTSLLQDVAGSACAAMGCNIVPPKPAKNAAIASRIIAPTRTSLPPYGHRFRLARQLRENWDNFQ
jgi:hypothetical protein